MDEHSSNANDLEGPPAKKAKTDPLFIDYMLGTSTKHSRVFLVGDPTLENPPEEIGVAKTLLMAHSETFRLMLEDSLLAEKGVVKVTDIQPDTFRNLLRFIYGYNILSTLILDEALDLLYVAEKYLVEELKPKLAKHICSILSVDNVCAALQRPECFEQKALKDAIDEIIQDYTDVLFLQEDFVNLGTLEIVYILDRDNLAVPEIELWRAVLKWADHSVMNKDGATVRQIITESLKYIRFCTLDIKDFCNEVCSAKILTDQEVVLIMESITKKTTVDNLTTVCNTIERRNLSSRHLNEVHLWNFGDPSSQQDSLLNIITHSSPMILVSAKFTSCQHPVFGQSTPEDLRFLCEIKISLTRLYDYRMSKDVKEPPVELVFSENICYDKEFKIVFINSGNYLKLSSFSKYILSFKFQTNHSLILCSRNSGEVVQNNNRFSFVGCKTLYYCTHVRTLVYKTG